jgi:hypothetical protein
MLPNSQIWPLLLNLLCTNHVTFFSRFVFALNVTPEKNVCALCRGKKKGNQEETIQVLYFIIKKEEGIHFVCATAFSNY